MVAPNVRSLPVGLIIAITNLVAALVLLILHRWLLKRSVKDPTLGYLSAALLVWATSGLCMYFVSASPMWFNWMDMTAGVDGQDPVSRAETIMAYAFSPLNSTLFILAALNLSRVRDFFQLKESAHRALHASAIALGIAQYLAIFLLARAGAWGTAEVVDALVSTIALTTLCVGMAYSYREYENSSMVVLTAAVGVGYISLQWGIALFHLPRTIPWISMHVALNILLTVNFIALAVFWAVSHRSRLVFRAVQETTIVALYFDLRQSTQWSTELNDSHKVLDVINSFRKWGSTVCDATFGEPLLVKYLGDGFLFVWERPDTTVTHRSAVAMGLRLIDEYHQWCADFKQTRYDPDELPHAVGIGIEVGRALRLATENGAYDYVGAPMNYANKYQGLAKPDGGLVISARMFNSLGTEFINRARFGPLEEQRLSERYVMNVHRTRMATSF